MTLNQVATGCGVVGGALVIFSLQMGSDRALFATMARDANLLKQAAPVIAENAQQQDILAQQLQAKGCTEISYELTMTTPLSGNAGDCYKNDRQTAIVGFDGTPIRIITQEGP